MDVVNLLQDGKQLCMIPLTVALFLMMQLCFCFMPFRFAKPPVHKVISFLLHPLLHAVAALKACHSLSGDDSNNNNSDNT